MRSPRRFAQAGFESTARCPSAARTHPATLRRHPAEEKDRWSFHHPDSIPQVGRELELLVLDGSTQAIFELSDNGRAFQRLGHWRPIGPSNMPVISLHASQKLANAGLEVRVA